MNPLQINPLQMHAESQVVAGAVTLSGSALSGSNAVACPRSVSRAWIVVASEDHVQTAVQGGFIQAGHGRHSAVAQFGRGDTVICYSARRHYGEREPCQRFTALGTILDTEPFAARVSESFSPFRRQVRWDTALQSAPVTPLLDRLSFIRDRRNWGYAFRFGVFRISTEDRGRIEHAMQSMASTVHRLIEP
jgi:hypothetical protein